MWDFSFICRASKADRNGLSPIELSIVIAEKRTYVRLQMKVSATDFKKKMNSRKNNEVLEYTSQVRNQLNKYANEMMSLGIPVTAHSLKEYFVNGGMKSYTLYDLQKDFIQYYAKKCEANNVSDRVLRKYIIAMSKFVNHIGGEIEINQVTSNHINDFKSTLISTYERTTVAYMIAKIKCAFQYAIDNGNLKTNVFSQVTIDRKSKEVQYLTNDEVEIIRNKQMNDRLERIKDLFLFQCYTALSYSDMAQITKDDIQNEQGMYYIRKARQKTKVVFFTVLNDEAMNILKKYDYVLPLLSNQKYNSYLKEIGAMCNLSKELHSHLARHTCATRLLNSGIPMEIVAKVLGHTTTKMTQHYAKLLDKTVLNAFKRHIG